MIPLGLPATNPGEGLKVLFIGAHSDDIEIGCGGTVLELLRARNDVRVHWVVLSATGAREDEARASAERFLSGAREANVVTHGFRDGFFPHQGAEVKEVFEGLKSVRPDLVFSHYGGDLHQDHRTAAELTWNTFRSHLVLEYEIPKYDGGLGSPNVFVPLCTDVRDEKVDILMDRFASQRSKRWFTRDTFEAIMRLRAIEAPGDAESAEAFYARKVLLDLTPR